MGIKVETTITCDVCKKKVKTAVRRIPGRRYVTNSYPDLFLVEANHAGGANVIRDPTEYDMDEATIACSVSCAKKEVARLLAKKKAPSHALD